MPRTIWFLCFLLGGNEKWMWNSKRNVLVCGWKTRHKRDVNRGSLVDLQNLQEFGLKVC